MANSNYKKENYEAAANQYQLLAFFNPNDRRYKAKWADSLMGLSFTYENQKRISDFLEMYKGESFAFLLEQKLEKFRADLDLKIGSNYIEKVPLNNQILRWEDDAFPLKVYVSQNNEYYNSIKKAFDYWTYATGNFVSFAYTDDVNEANIKVMLNGTAKSNCDGGGCLYVAALTSPDIKNGLLNAMDMTVYTKDPYGRPVDPDHLHRTVLHEIGHALGMMGHSDNPNSIMFAKANHEKSNYFQSSRMTLSKQDLNTLNYLYMIVPNISNVPVSELDTKNKIYPNIILGTSEEIIENDIKNAQEYIKNAPDLAVGYLDLGNAYVQGGMYNEALQTYSKAYELSATKDEQYSIVYNMATTCMRMNNYKKALEYAEFARKIKATSEVMQLIHNIKYPLAGNEAKY